MEPIPALAPSPWAGLYKRSETAKVRMYIIVGAGGTAAGMVMWGKLILAEFPEIELCVLEFPGRGNNNKGNYLVSVPAFMNAVREGIINPARKEWFGVPFVILGQSTGARLAYDIIRELAVHKLAPLKMYVVARSPPLVPDEKWIVEAPDDTMEYMNWITDELLESQQEKLKRLWGMIPAEDLKEREIMFRADLQLNAPMIDPLGATGCKVVAPDGKLVKKNVPTSDRIIQISREAGSILQTTGQVYHGAAGNVWVELDPAAGEKNKGWLLLHGKSVGLDHQLLEEVPSEEPQYWKMPVPVQVHVSDKDRIQPMVDNTGRLRPQAEWAVLTTEEPQFVTHEGFLHDALLGEPAVCRHICNDIIAMCNLRA
mmetsp:Transcript_55467/g.124990  ORF Transcript_55467/g.124990 Transcript_55467/m.124990 type:complete len:370 (+) Transcript_55467:70-1179(+)